ncbi:MAG TPA: hypothetical protein VNX28_00360 [Gemmataceae bacterium]|nr:hypothetical protein [Gemmataceae bacterium]
MTRRFRYWIIGTALVTAPLAGCAQWGRPGASRDPDGADLMTFWQRQFQGRGAGGPQPALENHAIAPEMVPPRAAESHGAPAPIQTVAETPELVTAAAGPQAPTTRVTELLPPIAAELAPPGPEVQSLPFPPVASQADSVGREPLVDALDCLFHDRYNDALQFLRNYDQPTQEIALRLLPMLKLMTQKSIEKFTPAEVAVLDDQMKSFSDLLRPRSSLVIDKACFCESILSYGNYEPLPDDHAFQSSTPNRPGERVLLYIELRNFASEAKNDGYVTRLVSSLEIRDRHGKLVCPLPLRDEKADRRHTRFQDLCKIYKFYVPDNLAAGTYTLVIGITDYTRLEQPRYAKKELEFHVTSMSARVP